MLVCRHDRWLGATSTYQGQLDVVQQHDQQHHAVAVHGAACPTTVLVVPCEPIWSWPTLCHEPDPPHDGRNKTLVPLAAPTPPLSS
jgi:hypothetical protein